MKKSLFSRVKLAGLLVLFVCTWTFFAGCKNAPDASTSGSDNIQQQTPSGENESAEQENTFINALLGTWISETSYGIDSYVITKTKVTYSSKLEGYPDYILESDLVDATASYIYIKTAPDAYTAISYKDLTEASCSMSTAYKQDGKTSTTTLEEAKTEFTVENGYFSFYGEYIKQ